MVERPPRILLVDDEQSVQTLLSYPLRKDGYEVVQAFDGREALAALRRGPFDLVVLDVMMPRLDGLEVCRRLRARSPVPIIMLTAKAEEIDKVLGLELGADDYITKPFSLREFRSRVKAALRRGTWPRRRPGRRRRAARGARPARRLGQAQRARARRRGGDPFVEFEILARWPPPPAGVWTRDMLLTRIWGDSAYRDPRTIDVHIRHLREKLERDAKDPEYLFTVRGVGYRFRDTEAWSCAPHRPPRAPRRAASPRRRSRSCGSACRRRSSRALARPAPGRAEPQAERVAGRSRRAEPQRRPSPAGRARATHGRRDRARG